MKEKEQQLNTSKTNNQNVFKIKEATIKREQINKMTNKKQKI